ncbi:MAG TPA: DUF5781 family protein [Conexivisphaerales archaeon]|nr:DUF5781 family protein [Conexivisphaerales archaeon]
MAEEPGDASLSGTLQWAIERMRQAGYPLTAKVDVKVDPDLKIMGYANNEGGTHTIVIAEWALDSEMLGGLILHELAHVYHTERGSPSHRSGAVEDVIREVAEREGLNERESAALLDVFSHLQNIMVDDIVFAAMSGRELKQAQRFFADWVSQRPTGDPVVDAVLLVRNAFAIASLRRRGVADGMEEMEAANSQFISFYGEMGKEQFRRMESFLEDADPDWSEAEFKRALAEYVEMVLDLMKQRKGLQDLR